MDILSLIGILIGLLAVLGGNIVEGGQLSALLNLPAGLIVIGGTFGAIILQTPLRTFVRAWRLFVWVFVPPYIRMQDGIAKIVAWSQTARKDGLLGLEGVADNELDPFAQKGLYLLIDGAEPEVIRSILELEVHSREHRDLAACKVFEGMGGYAPTMGILGAVLGLITVMRHLEDPAMLGPGIATAFVATVYGVGFANLFLFPVANKIKAQAMALAHYREMLIEGIVAISEGENPKAIDLKLRSFMDD
ncbi:MAG: flagellar motor protein [Gammaproteobacteria bacterium]|nr:MAG: flagellar motor protein [Gammaproteobacteria bacterium]